MYWGSLKTIHRRTLNFKFLCLSLSNASLVLPSNMCCVQLIINANNRVLTSPV